VEQDQQHLEEEDEEAEEDEDAEEQQEGEQDEGAEGEEAAEDEGLRGAAEEKPAAFGRRHASRRLRAAGVTHLPSMTAWLEAWPWTAFMQDCMSACTALSLGAGPPWWRRRFVVLYRAYTRIAAQVSSSSSTPLSASSSLSQLGSPSRRALCAASLAAWQRR